MKNAPSTDRTKRKQIEAPEWFFMWTTGKPYICAIVGWTRLSVIFEAEKVNGISWKKIYAQGGRAVRCTVRIKHGR